MCRLGQFFSPYTSHSSLQTLCSWHQLVTRFCDAGKNLRLPLPLDYFHRFICVWIFYLSSFFQCFVIAHQKAQFGVSSPRSFPGGDALQTHQPCLACSNYWMLIYTQLATWIIFFKPRWEFPRWETKINTRNYNSDGQSTERFSSAKLLCSRVALKRCIKTEIRWNR